MKPVQWLLMGLVVIAVISYFARLRSGMADRVLVLLFAALGMSMLIFPDWTNWLAAKVGVDSGAHLFIYLAILGFGFFGLVLFSQIRDLQSSVTELIRSIAIHNAVAPGDGLEDTQEKEETRSD